MGIHRLDAELKLLGDAVGRIAFSDELENLALAPSQPLQGMEARFQGGFSLLAGMLAHGRSDIHSSGGYDTDRRFQLIRGGAFDHIPGGPDSERSPDGIFPSKHGKNHHPNLRKITENLFGRLQAV